MGELIREEVQKTSQELIEELRSPANHMDRGLNLPQQLDNIIITRVEEKLHEYKKELELGQHVHAIMKFFKGVK